MAEYMYLRPDTFVYKVPDGLSPRVAVLGELMACAASLDKLKEFSSYAIGGFTSGDTVVVIGFGPLGLLHVAKADMMGAGQIIATDLAEDRLNWARRCGAEHVLKTPRRRRRNGSSGCGSSRTGGASRCSSGAG
jgi:threonine dehydrogenase-like Zn-dependent dehydrogenase